MDKARAVADVLGASTVRSEADSTLYLDVTVLLGSEWDLVEEETSDEEIRPWWDVKRWLRSADDGQREPGNES